MTRLLKRLPSDAPAIARGQGCCLCGEAPVTTIANLRVGARCLKHIFAIAVEAGVAIDAATFDSLGEVA